MIIKQHIASATGLAKFISVCDAGLSQARVGDSVINIKDDTGTDIGKYVNTALDHYKKQKIKFSKGR